MKAKTCFALAIAAGCATVASANPEKVTLNGQQSMSTAAINSIYYNVATGEMIRTDGNSDRQGAPIWVNEQYDQCGFGEWFYYGVRNDAAGANDNWMDWGDIQDNTVVDAMTFLYFTTVPDAAEDGEDGFSMVVSFFDNADWCCTIASAMAPYLAWEITGIPGTASGGTAWLITIDFADTPENWFEIGDVDGIDDSGNGLNSGVGADTDGLGNGADFAYGFNFNHPTAAVATTGCGMVVPPEGVEPNSLGSEDVFALFNGGWDVLENFYWFGGYSCAGGSGFAWAPWADYYLGLYEAGEPGPEGCNVADMAEPYGTLDFFDVQTFLAAFSAQDQSADLVDDNVWDFFDVQTFLAAFSAGCP